MIYLIDFLQGLFVMLFSGVPLYLFIDFLFEGKPLLKFNSNLLNDIYFIYTVIYPIIVISIIGLAMIIFTTYYIGTLI